MRLTFAAQTTPRNRSVHCPQKINTVVPMSEKAAPKAFRGRFKQTNVAG